MPERAPTFPPLLTGRRLVAGERPDRWAVKEADAGKARAGDIAWADDPDTLRLALVLEPDVPRRRCGEMLFAAMVAFGDAAGALAPPEISVTYSWPSIILLNDAQIGLADLVAADCPESEIPDWMVVSLTARVRPSGAGPEPGHDIDNTTMWDEGCGEISCIDLLESTSRHIVNWIHTWSEDGFGPVHEQWWGRVFNMKPLADGVISVGADGAADLVGLDESGNALIRTGDETVAASTLECLGRLRSLRNRSA